MILHSIVPADIVFKGLGREDDNRFLELDYMGEKVQVIPLENSRYRITRVISTSPQAYLNPLLQPGNIITGHLSRE